MTGAAGGAVAGYGLSEGNNRFDAKTTTAFTALVGGVIGMVAGGLAGGLAGHSDLYLFDPPR